MRRVRHSESYEVAQKFAEERFDWVIDFYDNGDWTEVRGEIGGDIETYRVYEDGSVYAR